MIDSYFTLFARNLNRLIEETKNKRKIGHILISKCVGRKKLMFQNASKYLQMMVCSLFNFEKFRCIKFALNRCVCCIFEIEAKTEFRKQTNEQTALKSFARI